MHVTDSASNPDPSSEPTMADDTTVHVYTDGACSGNPGPGGWAWASTDGRHGQGGEATTTNQRMELQAVLEALRSIDQPMVIHSDSTYVVNCFNDRWYEGWLKRDWKNSQRKPVANRDIWEPLIDLYLKRTEQVSFVWVKGHSGDKMNDLVDAMAVEETAKFRDSSVAGLDASPADGFVGPQPPWPIDQAVVVTGVAEPDTDQEEGLVEAIGGLTPGYDLLITGLRRGVELAAAELALQHGVSIGVVLPFEDPAARWPKPTLARFEACLAKADWVVTLEGDPALPAKAVAARNAWMWSAAVGAIIVGEPDLVDRLDELGLGVIAVD